MAVQTTYSKEQILKFLEENKEKIREFGVSRLGLFGSYARDEQKFDSDLDFYVEFKPGQKNYKNLLNLGFYLEDQFEKKVDLLTDKSVSNHFRSVMDKEILYVSIHS